MTFRGTAFIFNALGYAFHLNLNLESGESFDYITREKDDGQGYITIEEGSDLEDELIRAVTSLKRFQNFLDDAYDLMREDAAEPDWDEGYDQGDDVADALSAKDDEMGQ